MILSTYYPKTGQITGTISYSDMSNVPQGIQYVQGRFDPDKFYIKAGQAVAYPAKPYVSAWVQYNWDLATTTWIVNESASSANARSIRDNKLLAVDRINPIWWESMSEADRIQARAYRRELLNVPEQAGFPTSIVWPVKPSWL